MKTFMKHCDKICAETGRECQDFLEGDIEAATNFLIRFLICLYCQKFACYFSPGDMATFCVDDEKGNVLDVIRGKTWHKTVVSNNPMPTLTAICLPSKRIACTIKLNTSATSPEIDQVDLTKYAWKKYEEQTVLVPEWDTLYSITNLTLIWQAILVYPKC